MLDDVRLGRGRVAVMAAYNSGNGVVVAFPFLGNGNLDLLVENACFGSLVEAPAFDRSRGTNDVQG